MLKVYKAGNSICTHKVFITLAEKGLDYDTHNINLFKNEQYAPEYLKLNPKGVVPTLLHDDNVICESTLICEYLDEIYPTPKMIPDDAFHRTQMRTWSKAIDEGIFDSTREISFAAMFRDKMKNMTEEQRQIRFRNVGDPVKGARFRSTYEHGTDSPYVMQAVATYEKLFKNMDQSLSHGKDWMLGDDMTLGDISLMPYLARMQYLQLLDIWLADRPRVQAWFERAQQLDSYKSSIVDQLSKDEVGAMRTSGLKIKTAIKAHRDAYVAEYY